MNGSATIHHQVSKSDIIAEYSAADRFDQDYRRAKWGTRAGMMHRFQLALAVIEWNNVHRWLDVGCGEGGLFAVAEAGGRRFEELIGIDITPCTLWRARQRHFASPVRFIEADLEHMPGNIGMVDVVTLIGVLQQCGCPPRAALSACCGKLAFGGQMFLTTKNITWEAFTGGRLVPEESHSWFDPQELIGALDDLGITTQQFGGLLPRSGQVVEPRQSHTIYILGQKRHGPGSHDRETHDESIGR